MKGSKRFRLEYASAARNDFQVKDFCLDRKKPSRTSDTHTSAVSSDWAESKKRPGFQLNLEAWC